MNKITNFNFESFSSLLENYMKNSDMDMIKELVSQFSEITPYMKHAKQLWDFSQEIKYKEFIKGYEHKKDELRSLNKFQEKMKKLVQKERFMEFLFQTVSDAINSRSSKVSFILGMYVAEIVKGEKEIEEPSYENLLIINVLKSLNDWDITYFNKIYSFFNNNKEYTKFFSPSQIFKESIMQTDIDMSSSSELAEFKAVIDKLMNLQILTTGPAINLKNESYTVELTYYSQVLYELLKRSNQTN